MNTNVPTVGILNQETRSTTEPLAGMTPTMTPCVPPKFIPTCDSILTPNVASTLQWKRRRIRRVAWYAEDDFNVNPTSSLSCHVSCADFFRRRALFLPLTRRPATGLVGRLPRPPVCCMCNIGTYVQINSFGTFSSMFRRVVLYNRAHVRV